MCKGSGVPGNSTTSSGNKGIRASKQSPAARGQLPRCPDCIAALDFTSRRGIKARMDLAGKIAVVTGASMGLGGALARIFSDHGAYVVLLSRDASRVEAAKSRIG